MQLAAATQRMQELTDLAEYLELSASGAAKSVENKPITMEEGWTEPLDKTPLRPVNSAPVDNVTPGAHSTLLPHKLNVGAQVSLRNVTVSLRTPGQQAGMMAGDASSKALGTPVAVLPSDAVELLRTASK